MKRSEIKVGETYAWAYSRSYGTRFRITVTGLEQRTGTSRHYPYVGKTESLVLGTDSNDRPLEVPTRRIVTTWAEHEKAEQATRAAHTATIEAKAAAEDRLTAVRIGLSRHGVPVRTVTGTGTPRLVLEVEAAENLLANLQALADCGITLHPQHPLTMAAGTR